VSDWSTNAKEADPRVNDGRPAGTTPRSLAYGVGRLIRRNISIAGSPLPEER